MPTFRQMSETVSPLASSRSTSLSNPGHLVGSPSLLDGPSWAQSTGDSHFRWTSSWGADQCHHCHIFEMNGESDRFRESMKTRKGRKAE